MKKAFKFQLILSFLVVACIVNAQKYRLEVGYTNPDRFETNVSSTYFNGIQLGGTAEFDLKNNVSLLTGVLYNFVYSNKIQTYPNRDSVIYSSFGHFLDIPLRVIYSLPINKNLRFFGFAGPNLNIGLFQNQNITSNMSTSLNLINNIIPGKTDFYKNSILNRLNLQIGVGGGVQWKNYQLKSGYDFGINDLNKTTLGNQYQKGWYVTFAYEFNQKK